MAMARPNTTAIKKHKMVDQFQQLGLKSIINLCGLTCSSLILAKPYFTENHASTCCQGCFISHLERVGGMGGYATLS